MSPLIYWRQGEDGLPPPPIEDPADGWWAGVQQCFVAVPIAATLATVALSASLAFGYQQQTEDVVPAPTALAGDEGTWPVPVVLEEARPVLCFVSSPGAVTPAVLTASEEPWWPGQSPPPPPPILLVNRADEEIAPQAATLAGDEDIWVPLVAQPARPSPAAFSDDDVAPRLLEEEAWEVRPPRAAPPLPVLFLADDEVVPAVAVDDTGGWSVPQPPLAPPALLVIPQADDLAPPPTTFAEEDRWGVQTPSAPPPIAAPFQVEDDVITPLKVESDQDWSVRTPTWPLPTVTLFRIEDETITPLKVEGDQLWSVQTPPAPLPTVPLFRADDEIVPQPGVGNVEEDSLWPQPARAPLLVPQIWWGDEVLVAALDEDGWWFALPPPAQPVLLAPWRDDDLPTFAVEEEGWWAPFRLQAPPPTLLVSWQSDDGVLPLLGIDEEPWSLWTPAAPLPVVTVFRDPEEIPAGTLRGPAEEEYWAVRTPPAPLPTVTLFSVENETAQVLQGEEAYWSVVTPPPPPPRFLYLPDPEEIPAGSLLASAVCPIALEMQPAMLAVTLPMQEAATVDLLMDPPTLAIALTMEACQ